MINKIKTLFFSFVINQSFHIKLIDFGSTAYMVKGKKFATFCGTLDYCSPDVLLGNKYYGPELDVWTCGIALYTLIFSENPFVDAEETIECILKPPFKVSNGKISQFESSNLKIGLSEILF